MKCRLQSSPARTLHVSLRFMNHDRHCTIWHLYLSHLPLSYEDKALNGSKMYAKERVMDHIELVIPTNSRWLLKMVLLTKHVRYY